MSHEAGAWRGAAAGRGPGVVLLHGNPTSSFLYRHVIEALRDELRCLAPDLPGFGGPLAVGADAIEPARQAAWLGRWIDHEAPERFVLMAHDWGGPIGLAAAMARPERVAGLVLCNTWCWPPDAMMRAFSLLMGAAPVRPLHERCNLMVRWLLPWTINRRSRRDPRVVRGYLGPFERAGRAPGPWRLARSIRRSAGWLGELERQLGVFADRPVELVWGKRDPFVGRESVLDRWRRTLPRARVERLFSAGHFVPEDRPDRVAAAVRRVWARTA